MEIGVRDLEELYAAVNDADSASTTIRLRSGTYRLTPLAPNGQPRLNGGSLVLKTGMTLHGENQYVDSDGDGVPDARVGILDAEGREVYADPQTETIIDGDLLNAVAQGVVRGPLVVAGPIEASIRNLTVRGGSNPQAAIEIRAPGNNVSKVMVQECILEKGRRGIVVDALPRWGSANAEVHLLAEQIG